MDLLLDPSCGVAPILLGMTLAEALAAVPGHGTDRRMIRRRRLTVC